VRMSWREIACDGKLTEQRKEQWKDNDSGDVK
jgi:hypothetical protein